MLAAFIATLKTLRNEDVCIAVGSHTLALLAAQPSSLSDAAAELGELVAGAHESNEDFRQAAQTLAEGYATLVSGVLIGMSDALQQSGVKAAPAKSKK